MSVSDVNLQKPVAATQSRILALLDDLPPESLPFVEQLLQFLCELARQGQKVAILPISGDRLTSNGDPPGTTWRSV